MDRVPHKLNVPGDFYVEDGCCTACDLPSAEAPGFFKFEETENSYHPGLKAHHCYFCKQPADVQEVKLVIGAMQVQEIDCIRYKGKDRKIIKLMKDSGVAEFSDELEK